MKQKTAIRLLFCLVLAISAGSCVERSEELNLDKDISLDMHLAGDGLSIPLGSLDKIYLDSLLDVDSDTAGTIQKMDNGVYCIAMDGKIDEISVAIDSVRVEIDDPEIDPISTDFDIPAPDDVVIDTVTVESQFKMSGIDMNDINDALPTISTGQDNKPVTVEGIPDTIVYDYMGSKFNLIMSTVKDLITINEDGSLEDFDYTLPGFGKVTVPGSVFTIPRVEAVVEIPEKKTPCDFTYNSFPADVKQINTIYFGSGNNGQLMSFNINLGSVDSILYAPEYVIDSLEVTFPNGFVLAKDNACQYETSVSGNKLTMKNVTLRSKTQALDLSNPTSVTLSVYLVSMELNQGPDSPQSRIMTYTGDITYRTSMKVSGIPHVFGKQELYSNMSVNTKLALKDISVDTKSKSITLADGKVSSKFEVTGLKDVSRINSITFNPENSKFYLSISALDIAPFALDNDSSVISMLFDEEYQFDDSFCQDQNSKTVGEWVKDGNSQKLNLNADAIGKEICLKIQKMNLQQEVAQGKLNLETDVNYSATLCIAAKDGLSLSDLSGLGDQDCRIAAWGSLNVDCAEVVSSEIITPISDSTVIDIDTKVDDAIEYISEVSLKAPAGLGIQLKFKGVPSTVEEIELRDFTVTFPEMLNVSYSGKDTRVSLSGHDLRINGGISKAELSDQGNGFAIEGLAIEGISFAENPIRTAVDGKYFTMNGQKVKFHGEAVVDSQTVRSSELDNITVQPTVRIDPMTIKSVRGRVNPEIDPVSVSVAVDLGDDLDFIRDEGNSFGLDNPQLVLNMKTSLPVPICLDMNISSILDGEKLIEDVRPDSGTITIPACPDSIDSKMFPLLFYCNERARDENSDTIYVPLSGFKDLLDRIPDSISFNIVASAEHENEYTIDLTRDFTVEGNYDVNIPLEFKDLLLCYSDTIDGLGEDLDDLSDITDKMGKLKCGIRAKLESTIPLGLNLKVRLLDKNGIALSGATVSDIDILLGHKDQPVTSDLNISLDLNAGVLSKVDAIAFKVTCSSGEIPESLDATEYILLSDIFLDVPGGLDIDLSDK